MALINSDLLKIRKLFKFEFESIKNTLKEEITNDFKKELNVLKDTLAGLHRTITYELPFMTGRLDRHEKTLEVHSKEIDILKEKSK